jgi:hypothetical protein
MSAAISSVLSSVGFFVPQEKLMVFLAVLTFWLVAVVLSILAWANVPQVHHDSSSSFQYTAKISKNLREYMTFMGWSNLFTSLTFFAILMFLVGPSGYLV